MTTVSRAHCTPGICPACDGLVSHFSAVRVSSGLPPLKPLARQPVAAAGAQAAARFGARAQVSRPSPSRVFGSRTIAVAAFLVASIAPFIASVAVDAAPLV